MLKWLKVKPKHWDYFPRWDKWDTLLETWCQLYTEPGWKPQTREQQEVWNLITHQALEFRDYKILLSWIFFLFIWRKKGLSCVFDLLFRTLNPRAIGSCEFHVLKGWTLTSTNWYSVFVMVCWSSSWHQVHAGSCVLSQWSVCSLYCTRHTPYPGHGVTSRSPDSASDMWPIYF